jgi:hypothetical protein
VVISGGILARRFDPRKASISTSTPTASGEYRPENAADVEAPRGEKDQHLWR